MNRPPHRSVDLSSIPRRGLAARAGRGALLGLFLTSFGGCQDRGGPDPGTAVAPRPEARDEIPPGQLAAVLAAHYRGLGHMERYEYPAAAAAFREVAERAPGWTPGAINLAIALLNQGGEAQERAKQAGRGAPDRAAVQNIEAARQIFDEILRRIPDQRYALFSRGIILRSQGFLEEAHRDFRRVVELDPSDGHAWMELGASLTDPDQPGMPNGRRLAPRLIELYGKSLEANPNLTTAMFKLQAAYGYLGDRAKQAEFNDRVFRLSPLRNPANPGDVADLVYGEMGKYARVVDPFPRPAPLATAPPVPRFAPLTDLDVRLEAGDRWATPADFAGPNAPLGLARDRFGAGVAAADFDNDGRIDLYLTAAVVGPKGLRDCLLMNRGEGRFEDQTVRLGLPLDRAGLGVAAADFDADRYVDLYLTGPGNNRLFRRDGERFRDVTDAAGVAQPGAISLTARWFDIDQDGDLDLYVVNYAPLDAVDAAFRRDGREQGRGLPNAAFRNDGVPASVENLPADNAAPIATAAGFPAVRGLSVKLSADWPSAAILRGSDERHTGVAFVDIDDDRDFDLVLTADGPTPTLLTNDRIGRFRSIPLRGWEMDGPANGIVAVDLDKDGRTDLVATGRDGRCAAWINATPRTGTASQAVGATWPTNATRWRDARVADLDLDTWPDLVALPGDDAPGPLAWGRNSGSRLDARPVPLVPGGTAGPGRGVGFALADLAGDALPDVVLVRAGLAPQLARNLGNGRHWLSVDLSGRWKHRPDLMRTNSEGLGTRLALEGAGLFNPLDVASLEAGTAQSVGPVVLGLDVHVGAPLLRLRWPDGVMQAELNVAGDSTLKLDELNRKTGSCPILFTWNGARFACRGDFAGAAGLGFLEAPGNYHPPDRDEALAISAADLVAERGRYLLRIVEPMDEVAYLDHLDLDVVDLPPTVATALDERFAFEADRPTGDLFAWSEMIRPVAARDADGRDVLATLDHLDRVAVEPSRRTPGRIGFADEHALTLEFGDRLDRIPPGADLRLALGGWVEYPYSQTNYAAYHSGVVLAPPVLEQLRADGGWEVIDPNLGHPAGLTRLMTKSFRPLPGPGYRPTFRVRTNLDCSWDQAFIAVADGTATARLRVARLRVARAELGRRGYLRESSSDGQRPALPDYDHVDPAPLSPLRGCVTRQGDVADLLRADDDQLCVLGPGDEVRLEFDAGHIPPLPDGWTRTFVLRSVAYCKDADPFTATSDSVGPLPWRAMPSFPPPPGVARPRDPAYDAYLREYQTRPAGLP